MKGQPYRTPTPQDYNEVIQNPKICFDDSELRQGVVEVNALGLPKAASGTFASVYKITSQGNWAVRCFLTQQPELEERYKCVSDFVRFDDLACTVDFQYLAKGIKVGNLWYPVVKMPWIEGPTLETYLVENISRKDKITALKNDFQDLSMALENAGIAHGDLQHGNIIVSPDGLRLIDYDAFFVPALKGRRNLEYGHPNYQHPLRDDYYFDVSVDNFSSWLIFASLNILEIDASLFDEFNGGDDCILFKHADLADPINSKLFQTLESHRSDEIKKLSKKLKAMLCVLPHLVPPLGATEGQIEDLLNVQQNTKQISNSFVKKISAALISKSQNETPKPGVSSRSQQRSASVKPKRKGLGKITNDYFHSTVKKSAPLYWMTLRTLDGNDNLKRGAYEEAHTCFLDVRESHLVISPDEKEQEIALLLRLCLCANQLNSKSLADNYCLLAAQIASARAGLHQSIYDDSKKVTRKSAEYGDSFLLEALTSFYNALSDFLNNLAGKGASRNEENASMFAKLMNNSQILISYPKSIIVLSAVIELVNTLIDLSKFSGSRASCRVATMELLDYAEQWSGQCFLSEKQRSDSRVFFCAQIRCLRQLAVDVDPVLKMRVELISKLSSKLENSDMIVRFNHDRPSLKMALLQSSTKLGNQTAMSHVMPSLRALQRDDPRSFDDTVLWLWKEVVNGPQIYTSDRIEWLKQFKPYLIAQCLDKDAQNAILASIKSSFSSSFDARLDFILVRALHASIADLGQPYKPFSDQVWMLYLDKLESSSEFMGLGEFKQIRSEIMKLPVGASVLTRANAIRPSWWNTNWQTNLFATETAISKQFIIHGTRPSALPFPSNLHGFIHRWRGKKAFAQCDNKSSWVRG